MKSATGKLSGSSQLYRENSLKKYNNKALIPGTLRFEESKAPSLQPPVDHPAAQTEVSNSLLIQNNKIADGLDVMLYGEMQESLKNKRQLEKTK